MWFRHITQGSEKNKTSDFSDAFHALIEPLLDLFWSLFQSWGATAAKAWSPLILTLILKQTEVPKRKEEEEERSKEAWNWNGIYFVYTSIQ